MAMISRRLKQQREQPHHDEQRQHIVVSPGVLIVGEDEETSSITLHDVVVKEDEEARNNGGYDDDVKKCRHIFKKEIYSSSLREALSSYFKRILIQVQQQRSIISSLQRRYRYYDYYPKRRIRHFKQGIIVLFLLLVSTHWIKEHFMKKDPYLYALIKQPLVYFQLRFLEEHPMKSTLHNYVMTKNNSFVISLLDNKNNTNLTRYERFKHINRFTPAKKFIQRFNAVRWPESSDNQNLTTQHKLWLEQYPFIQQLIEIKKYGDIGCFLSHMILFQQLNKSKTENYYFIFEDDAKFDKRVKHGLGKSRQVFAPVDADIIALTRTAMQRVKVPLRGNDDHPDPNNNYISFVTRVIGGYGGYGYVVTKSGASSLIDYYYRNYDAKQQDPIDVVMMNSHQYFNKVSTNNRRRPPLKVYFSHRGVTEVHHVPDPNFTSTRKHINKDK